MNAVQELNSKVVGQRKEQLQGIAATMGGIMTTSASSSASTKDYSVIEPAPGRR